MNFNELFQKMRELDQPVTEEPNEGNAFSGALDAAKDAGKDEFEVDGKTFQVKEDDVEECGMGPMPSMNQEQQDTVTMNLSMNGSGSGGIRDLLDILKNIDGNDGSDEQLGKLMGKMDKEPIIGDVDMPMDEYANSPDEVYGTVGDVTQTGNDIHSKGAEAPKVNGGGNPFGVDEELINRLARMYESIKESTAPMATAPMATTSAPAQKKVYDDALQKVLAIRYTTTGQSNPKLAAELKALQANRQEYLGKVALARSMGGARAKTDPGYYTDLENTADLQYKKDLEMLVQRYGQVQEDDTETYLSMNESNEIVALNKMLNG